MAKFIVVCLVLALAALAACYPAAPQAKETLQAENSFGLGYGLYGGGLGLGGLGFGGLGYGAYGGYGLGLGHLGLYGR